MLALSDWMIRAVCNQLRVWNDAGLGAERVSINLSPQCLHRVDNARIGIAVNDFGIAKCVKIEGPSIYLVNAGRTTMQGHLFYKPLPAAQFYKQFQQVRLRNISNDAT